MCSLDGRLAEDHRSGETLRVETKPIAARSEREPVTAVTEIAQQHCRAPLVMSDPIYSKLLPVHLKGQTMAFDAKIRGRI